MFKTQAIALSPIHFNEIADATPFNLVTLMNLYTTTQYAYVVREQNVDGSWCYYIMPSKNVVMGFSHISAGWNDAYIK